MNNTSKNKSTQHLVLIVSSIMLLVSVMMLTGCTKVSTPDFSNAVFEIETYGGLVRPDMVRQLLIIDSTKLNYTVYDIDGKITLQFQKPVSKETYQELVDVFTNNKFIEFKDNYTSPEPLLDAGAGRISLKTPNYEKTIIINPFVLNYLPDDVKNVADAMQYNLNTIFNMDESQLKAFSEQWIKAAPTYAYDGSGLEFIEYEKKETVPETYYIKYNFTSASSGYGNRSDYTFTQEATNHVIELSILRNKVLSATIDDKWDELNRLKIGDYEIKYQPKQCIDTPWRKWYASGQTSFVKKPSEEELLITYYTQEYDIGVQSFKMHYSDPVLAVCGNNESYYITATVNNTHLKNMIRLGWMSTGNYTEN